MSTPIQYILANRAVSISDLKKNPMAVVNEADDVPLVILSHNKPAFYCMSTEVFEEFKYHAERNKLLLEQINNLMHDKLFMERIDSPGVKVSIDEL